MQVAAFALVITAAAARARRWAVPPLLAVVAAEAVRAHPAQQAPGWGAVLTGVHLLAAAVWAGALVQVVRTALRWRGHRRQAWALVGAYARLAGWLFAVVVATGTVAALLLVPWADWTGTAYGRTLPVTIALVSTTAVLALLAAAAATASGHRGAGVPARTGRRGVLGGAAVAAVAGRCGRAARRPRRTDRGQRDREPRPAGGAPEHAGGE